MDPHATATQQPPFPEQPTQGQGKVKASLTVHIPQTALALLNNPPKRVNSDC